MLVCLYNPGLVSQTVIITLHLPHQGRGHFLNMFPMLVKCKFGFSNSDNYVTPAIPGKGPSYDDRIITLACCVHESSY